MPSEWLQKKLQWKIIHVKSGAVRQLNGKGRIIDEYIEKTQQVKSKY
jgi:hypothetical protein